MTFKMIPGASDAIPKAGLRFRSPDLVEDVGRWDDNQGSIFAVRGGPQGGGNSNIFCYLHPDFGENDPI